MPLAIALSIVAIVAVPGARAQAPLWGQYGGDAHHSKRSGNLGPREPPSVKWSVESVVPGAALLITGAGNVVFGGAYGTIEIYDGETGGRLARTQLRPAQIAQHVGTTALSEDGSILYAGLYAMRGVTNPGPLLYALDAVTLATRWNALDTAVGTPGIDAPLLVYRGVVYASPHAGPGIVYALDGASGATLWSAPVPARYVGGGPVLSASGMWLAVSGSPCTVVALNASNGAQLWSQSDPSCNTPTRESFDSPPVAGAGGVVFVPFIVSSGYAHSLRAFGTDGAQLWSLAGMALGSPAVGAASLLAAPAPSPRTGDNASFLELSPSTGAVLQSTNVAFADGDLGTPALDAAGTLFVTAPNACVVAVDTIASKRLWTWCSTDESLRLGLTSKKNAVVIGANGTIFALGGHNNVGKATIIALH